MASPGTSQPTAVLFGTPKDFESSIGDIDLFLSTLGMMILIDNHQTATALPLASSIVQTLSQYPPPHKFEGLIIGKVTVVDVLSIPPEQEGPAEDMVYGVSDPLPSKYNSLVPAENDLSLIPVS